MHWCADINALQRPLLHTSSRFFLQLEEPVYCVSGWRFPGISAALLFSKRREDDERLDHVWLCSSLTDVLPLQNTASCVCTRWTYHKPSLFIHSAHKKQRKPSNSKPFFELSASRGGLSKTWCYKSKLESLPVKLKERTELWVRWPPPPTLGNSHIIFRIFLSLQINPSSNLPWKHILLRLLFFK